MLQYEISMKSFASANDQVMVLDINALMARNLMVRTFARKQPVVLDFNSQDNQSHHTDYNRHNYNYLQVN